MDQLNNLPEGVSGDIVANSQFLGITPEQFLEGVGLMKATNNNKDQKSPGITGRPNVLRGFNEPVNNYFASARGIVERFRPISFSILREIEDKNPLIAAINNTRCKQVKPFSQKSKGEDEPGFRIALRDDKKKPTSHEQDEMKELANWFWFTGRNDFLGWDDREDNFGDVMEKMVRDYYTVNKVNIELRRDRRGRIVDFWMFDPETIYRVLRTGYRGSKSDFDPRVHMLMDTKLEKMIAQAKLDLIPDPEQIRYVQMIDGRLCAAYTRQDMIEDSLQKSTDIRRFGRHRSPVEQAISACTAFMFGIAYNAEQFNSGTLPKIALAFKDGNFSEEQLISLQDAWIASFQGLHGAWRIPMFNQETQVIDLFKNPRDMEYMKYMEFMGSLICAVMGIDSSELGLRWQQAQSVLNENAGSRLHFSKNRGLNDMLGTMREVWNKVLMYLGLAEKYKFEYTGIEPEDRELQSKLDTEAVKRDKTINELRKEKDLPPDPFGDIILDPSYLQYRMQKEAMEQGGMGEGEESQGGLPEGEGNIFEEATNEAIDEIYKAKIDKTKIRTALL